MKSGTKKVFAVFAAALFIGSVCAVAFYQADKDRYSPDWVNYCITENIYPDYKENAAAENFYAFAHNEPFTDCLTAKTPEEANLVLTLVSTLAMKSLINLSEVSQCVKGSEYDRLSGDTAAREALGLTNIRTYVEEIDSISSIDELDAFLETGGMACLSDSIALEDVFNGPETGERCLTIMPGTVTFQTLDGNNVTDDDRENNFNAYRQALMLFFAEDTSKVDRYCDDLRSIEDELKKVKNDGVPSGEMTYEELCASYPLIGYDETVYGPYIDNYAFSDKAWMEKLCGYHDEAGLSKLKSLEMYDLLINSLAYADAESAKVLTDNGIMTDVTHDMSLYAPASMYIGLLYADKYLSDDSWVGVSEALIYTVVSEAKEYYLQLDWLSDETKLNVSKKFDNMVVRAVAPSDEQRLQYGYDDLDGSDFYSWIISLKKANQQTLIEQYGLTAQECWPIFCLPGLYNAFYNPQDNSINILGAYVHAWAPDYSAVSLEATYAYLATTIGHEITHGFDVTGSKYDEKGALKDGWMFSGADKRTYDQRTEKFVRYLDGICMLTDDDGSKLYIDGKKCVGEAVADLGGMRIALQMASKIDDFDYDKFFKAYADCFGFTSMKKAFTDLVQIDVHLQSMYRTNVTLQQMELFAEFYGVTEEDGMYIPEKDRIEVW